MAVLEKYWLKNENALGSDVGGLKSDEVCEEGGDFLRAVWEVEDYLAEALDRTFGDVVVDVGHVFVELGADFFDGFVSGDFREDF